MKSLLFLTMAVPSSSGSAIEMERFALPYEAIAAGRLPVGQPTYVFIFFGLNGDRQIPLATRRKACPFILSFEQSFIFPQ